MLLESSPLFAVAAGLFLGVIGLAPIAAMFMLVRSRRLAASVSGGLAAVAVSFVVLMTGVASVYVVAPRAILMVAAGILGVFLVLWIAIAVVSVRR